MTTLKKEGNSNISNFQATKISRFTNLDSKLNHSVSKRKVGEGIESELDERRDFRIGSRPRLTTLKSSLM